MTAPITIAILVYDGVQILDVSGPAAVFAAANDACPQPVYQVHILSAAGGAVRSSSAMDILSEAMTQVPPVAVDLLLIAGGDEAALLRLAHDPDLSRWLAQASASAARFGSICTGALLLAALGLVKGKRVTTHWSACRFMADSFPEVEVDGAALYVEDGKVWTSAGVTTGIDMCLAIVERDLGTAAANRIAERLVLYARRPGYQSQFSPLLHAQQRADAPFSALIEWMAAHLGEPLNVPQLASRMAMSERSFYRRFTESVGETPARFAETLRLDRARDLLMSKASLKEVAGQVGFGSAARLSKAFERRFGVTPQLFRETQRMQRASSSAPASLTD
ncbi:GlxA family transcriptional regulator [Noviherbaspirillum sp. Root189]|uniref:GlxA family transcriptional regulator n=1 Tax=Noviherbaspirillum sp. Root189 TaxID=1736487 RepID=UPI00070ECAD0|nr:helix-turn-helix domain-containing protein [Noviherbaspirillum sp. Root189]KRB94171.1 AraC family transcriptional regulator [Noviherbaspirillum sp. Root189]